MAAKKLSEIPQGVATNADFVVGVTAGNVDKLFPVSGFSGGSGNPAGLNTDIQFNNAGSFGGNSSFTYTGPTTTGSATNGVGINLLGTLNTSGVVDGAILFANITNTTSGAGTLLVDLQVNNSSVFTIDPSGNLFISGSGEVSSSTGLTITQTGDTFGPTGFFLANRFGINGAVFEQLGTVSVVDFVFKINGSGGFNGQNNFRYERRQSQFVFTQLSPGSPYVAAPNTVYEFQQGGSSTAVIPNPSFIVGDTSCGMIAPAGLNSTFWISGTSNVVSDLTYVIQGAASSFLLKASARLESRAGNFLTSLNTIGEIQFGAYNLGSFLYALGDTVAFFGNQLQFSTNTTGGGSALLGANCPAVTLTAPYTWIKARSSDGSQVYIPAWK